MQVAVLATDEQWEELTATAGNVVWQRVLTMGELAKSTALMGINLLDNAAAEDYTRIQMPVLINSVSVTLKEMNTSHNVVRINGWRGFIARPKWELAGIMSPGICDFFAAINKEYVLVKDEPGLVAGRVIAMIVNEAYFALAEKVSTKADIDIAMKLGTNYPYGPFEWSELIGKKNICLLLQKLQHNNTLYSPAPFLQEEAYA